MEIFNNDDNRFVSWIDANPDGYFLNQRGQNSFMLHKSKCGHIKFTVKVDLTAHTKVCSTDMDELKTYAKNHSSTKLMTCASCDP